MSRPEAPQALYQKLLHYLELRLRYALLQGQGVLAQLAAQLMLWIVLILSAFLLLAFASVLLVWALNAWLGAPIGLLAITGLWVLSTAALVLRRKVLVQMFIQRLERALPEITFAIKPEEDSGQLPAPDPPAHHEPPHPPK